MRTERGGRKGRRAHTEPLIRLPGTAAGARYSCEVLPNTQHLAPSPTLGKELSDCLQQTIQAKRFGEERDPEAAGGLS